MKDLKEKLLAKINEEFVSLKETRSDIGSGYAEIFRASGRSKASLNAFWNDNEVYLAKDLESGIEKSLKSTEPVVLVTNSYKDILRAYPIINGSLRLDGMYGGSWVYTSDSGVMKGYSHPIRLMDRFE
jgi:hypothetical protein